MNGVAVSGVDATNVAVGNRSDVCVTSAHHRRIGGGSSRRGTRTSPFCNGIMLVSSRCIDVEVDGDGIQLPAAEADVLLWDVAGCTTTGG